MENQGSSSAATPSAKTTSQKMITLGLLTHYNIEVVKRINRGSFPLTYGERFYSMIVDNRELSRLAFVCDIPVGAVCCRLAFPDQLDDLPPNHGIDDDAAPQSTPSLAPPRLRQWELTTTPSTVVSRSSKKPLEIPTARLCILTLAVLASYRRSGIGRMLIEWIIQRCQELTRGEGEVAIGGIPGLTQGQTQVKITEIYLHVWSANQSAIEFYKGLGFEQGETLKGYYRNLTPPDCVVFKKPLSS